MDNIYDQYLAKTKQDIPDKTLPSSITRFEVYDALTNLGQIAAFFNLANPSLSYPKGYPVRDAAFDIYVSKNNNVLGNVANTTNWKKISGGGAGTTQIFDLEAIGTSNVYQSTDVSVTAYSAAALYIVTPDVPNTGAATYQINALGSLPIMKALNGSYAPVGAGDFSTTSLFLNRGSFWLMVSGYGSSYGGKIADAGLIAMIDNPSSWADPLNSIWLMGPVTGKEGSYYVNTNTTPTRPGYETTLLYINGGTDLYPVRKVIIGV